MRVPPNLTLPGLLALIALAAVLLYLERDGGGGSPAPRSATSPQTTALRPDAASGAFDYYSLVLSWSPTHCESPEGQDDHAQCAPRNGRRYAFILHGLWPQYERGYPEDCPAKTTWVPQPVIDDMLDVMPSRGLIIHEYRKHGTCSGLSPEAYYRTARRLYDSLTIPQRFRNPTAAQFLDPDDAVDAFVAANPQLKPDMVAVACRGPGSRLREVRICFSKAGVPRSCGVNEDQGKLCRSARMHVPPVR
ncbi:ribonuclease T [Hyphomicrobium sp.]|uniref:ribonuclease T2 family protein n=1 Tax=Hyphomicrobium sp. TaxID=82 RepID=UPI0025C6CD26|nr:ribonuclease T [Hyphomicrobium sp.]MCC7253420.1 ribonuclease T [Hyphomicrobium sp.]